MHYTDVLSVENRAEDLQSCMSRPGCPSLGSNLPTVTASKMKSNEPLEVLFQTFDVIGL